MNMVFGLQNRAGADEPDARHNALHDTRLGIDGPVVQAGGHHDPSTASETDQRKRTNTHTVRLFFLVPTDRDRQQIGSRQLGDVLHFLGPDHTKNLFF